MALARFVSKGTALQASAQHLPCTKIVIKQEKLLHNATAVVMLMCDVEQGNNPEVRLGPCYSPHGEVRSNLIHVEESVGHVGV